MQEMQETWVQSLGWEDPLEYEIATHSSILACCCEVTPVVSDSVRPHRRQATSLPVPGILQARTLEWVAISFYNA